MQIQRRRTRNVDLQCSGDLGVSPPVRSCQQDKDTFVCVDSLFVDRSELALGAYMFLCVGYSSTQ